MSPAAGDAYTCGKLRERPNQCQKRGHDRPEPPLQGTRRAHANQLPHEEPKMKPPEWISSRFRMLVGPRR